MGYPCQPLARASWWRCHSISSLIMGPKPKPTYNVELRNGVTGEAVQRSTCSSQGIGGALWQLEHIQNHQIAPHIPWNEEVCQIQSVLNQQPNNLFAPSSKSRKTAKESEVYETCYIFDCKLMNNVKTLIPAPPSPVLPRKQVSTQDLYGFYDNRDFSQPPFTQ